MKYFTNSDSDMTCGYGVPYSEFVLCSSPIQVHTHTAVSSEHTHREHTPRAVLIIKSIYFPLKINVDAKKKNICRLYLGLAIERECMAVQACVQQREFC